jgi:hypothetical protein
VYVDELPCEGEEPVVEALKVRVLPEGGFRSYPRCGVSGAALNAPKSDENPSEMRGMRVAMIASNRTNLHKS